jgi:hypothetical protein
LFEATTHYLEVFNRSAIMARQGGSLQWELSNMHLTLNMAIMGKGGVSRTSIEEMQYVIKKCHAEVLEETTQGVEFPEHKWVNAAMERHQAMLHPDHTAGCVLDQNGTTKNR